MTATNIERFNDIVGIIFGKLYESFPVKTDIMALDIVGGIEKMEYFGNHDAEDVLTASRDDVMFFLDTVDWLQDSGYLTAVGSTDGIHSAVLTAKGLEVLNATPGSLETPLGARILDTAKSEGKEALRSLVSQALGIGLQYVTRGLM
uniref:hypothetical protein n=1 Tax=Serratia quinivorans TaxID=137545 RepID=UPI0035C73130